MCGCFSRSESLSVKREPGFALVNDEVSPVVADIE